MRRRLALILGICTVLTAGTATAAEVWNPDQPVGRAEAPAFGVPTKGESSRMARTAPADPTPRVAGAAQRGPVWSVGAEETGKVERAETTLGYVGTRTDATFRYPGADYVKLHFTRLALLPGDYLTVSKPDGTESHRYDGKLLEGLGDTVNGLLGQSAGKWAMSVTGDTAVVKLHLANDLLGLRGSLAEMGVTVDRVARGFTATERAAKRKADDDRKRALARNGREESICGGDDKADAICYKTSDPVMYRRAKAVARVLINGTELCTAWRVGPNNRLLTNHHCFTTTEEAADTEVWFNYQCARCGGYEVFRPTKVWAGQVLATDKRLDYTLFTVDDFAAIQQFGYLQLDVRPPTRGEQLYIPQNPAGEPTMIAVASDADRAGNCQVVDPAYDGYDTDTDASYYCDTEGGSSGSPVLSRTTDKVVALHHFGGCPNSGVRIDQIYKELATLL